VLAALDFPVQELPAVSPELLSVLRRLSHERFTSGEALAGDLRWSRTTVHSLIRQALALGVPVQAIRGRGYRLGRPRSWLDAGRLAAGLEPLGYAIQVLPHCDSTNGRMLRQAAEGAGHKSVVAAEWQSAGRGRRGSEWKAGLGGSLLFSVLWRFQRPAIQLSGLSLATGLALALALADLGIADASLKWPNDVLLAQGKLGGILIELQGDMLEPAAAVIGIGLNIDLPAHLRREIPQPVATLADGLGRHPDRNEVLMALLRRLDATLSRFDREGFEAFRADWEARHAHRGQPVDILGSAGLLCQGIARGVDGDGALLVETPGGLQRILSGEVSLRAEAA
jgi:BirA family transcriptional regulator, biotin operon repressor / biotin---[acetyl-CoA-carboxylase] ligase